MLARRMLPALALAIVLGGIAFIGTSSADSDSAISPYAASLAAMIGIAVFISLFLGIEVYSERRDVTRRVQILRGQRSQVAGRSKKSIHRDRIINQSSQLKRKLTASATRFMGISNDKMSEMRLLLLQAGYLGDRALVNFLIAKAVLPFIGLFVGLIAGTYYLHGTAWPSLGRIMGEPEGLLMVVAPDRTTIASLGGAPPVVVAAGEPDIAQAVAEGRVTPATPDQAAVMDAHRDNERRNNQLLLGAIVMGGGLLGSISVEAFLKRKVKDRAQKIWEDIPDTIDLMIIYTETGSTLDTALPRIIDEIRETCPALALELQILRTELRMQAERSSAYDNLMRRVDIGAVKGFASIVKQSERMGTPVSHGLAQLSSELRRERMLVAERRASRVPVLITFPLMLFIMPAMFVVVLGPTIMRAMEMLG